MVLDETKRARLARLLFKSRLLHQTKLRIPCIYRIHWISLQFVMRLIIPFSLFKQLLSRIEEFIRSKLFYYSYRGRISKMQSRFVKETCRCLHLRLEKCKKKTNSNTKRFVYFKIN